MARFITTLNGSSLSCGVVLRGSLFGPQARRLDHLLGGSKSVSTFHHNWGMILNYYSPVRVLGWFESHFFSRVNGSRPPKNSHVSFFHVFGDFATWSYFAYWMSWEVGFGVGWGQTIEDAKSLTMEKCRKMLEGLEGNPLPPITLPEDSTLRHG